MLSGSLRLGAVPARCSIFRRAAGHPLPAASPAVPPPATVPASAEVAAKEAAPPNREFLPQVCVHMHASFAE